MVHIAHPRFNLADFAPLFPLAELRERGRERAFLRPGGQIVTSPFHLAVIELLRRETLGTAVPASATPVDVFVFGAGEPPAPYLTKIGGVPFRSRRKAWPRTSDGRLLGFVGQISFVDSTDLLPSPPGEVLLVFVDPEKPLSDDAYFFEWITLDEGDLLSKSDTPDISFTWKPGRIAQKRGALPEARLFAPFVCHGFIHRTFELPGGDAVFSAYAQSSRLAVFEATKIGGVPHWIQAPRAVAGRFVASLASIQPAPEVAYPWTNEPSPLGVAARHAIPTWKLGDMGSLHLFEKEESVLSYPESY
jgi:hypothetical protein